jgi:hypothetical protein
LYSLLKSPLGVERLAVNSIELPVIVPVTGASPRSPCRVPVRLAPSCVKVSVCVTSPLRHCQVICHAPATFAFAG